MTTVGASVHIGPEIAANFSAGGFSRYFDQPKYQKEAVGKFLKSIGNEHKGLFKYVSFWMLRTCCLMLTFL